MATYKIKASATKISNTTTTIKDGGAHSISDDDGDGYNHADAQEATTAKVRSLPELLLQNFICSGS